MNDAIPSASPDDLARDLAADYVEAAASSGWMAAIRLAAHWRRQAVGYLPAEGPDESADELLVNIAAAERAAVNVRAQFRRLRQLNRDLADRRAQREQRTGRPWGGTIQPGEPTTQIPEGGTL
jgi:hypothetical protein